MTEHEISRRRFVGAAAATAAGLAVPATARAEGHAPAASPQPPRRRGRGRRGLRRPGRRAGDRRAGRSVLVLEARDRVGGRALEPAARRRRGLRAGGDVRRPDAGPHPRAREGVGVPHVPDLRHGRPPLHRRDGHRLRYTDTGPTGNAPPDPAILGDLVRAVARARQLSKDVPVDAPWTAAKAAEYDGQSVQSWVQAAQALSPAFTSSCPS